MRKFAIGYAIVMGIGMLGMWAMFFAGGQVPEVKTAPIALAFHLAAELVTAILLIVAGIGVWRRTLWARPTYYVAVGMLFYTAVVSPGYFAQQGQWGFVGMFGAFLLLAIPALIGVSASEKSVDTPEAL